MPYRRQTSEARFRGFGFNGFNRFSGLGPRGFRIHRLQGVSCIGHVLGLKAQGLRGFRVHRLQGVS